METIAAAGLGVVLILILLIFRWKLRASMKKQPHPEQIGDAEVIQGCQLVHRLCPHNNVVQGYDVEEKDSLDEHLDVLAKKLAEKVLRRYYSTSVNITVDVMEKDSLDDHKHTVDLLFNLLSKSNQQESRLQLSKSKIRETQNEIQSLHAIDQNVRLRYREIMDSLRSDLTTNEKECRKLQEQIEWVSRRRAELKEEASVALGVEHLHRIPERGVLVNDKEWRRLRSFGRPCRRFEPVGEQMVRRGHRLYGEAAAELASNLAELQNGRTSEQILEKSVPPSTPYPRHRKEPHLPNAVPMSPTLVIKSSPPSAMERQSQMGYHTPTMT